MTECGAEERIRRWCYWTSQYLAVSGIFVSFSQSEMCMQD